MTMYERIKQLRLAREWSQTELAEKAGYADKSAIAKIESGSVDIPRSKIQAFADAFCVSPSYLMDGDTSGEKETTPPLDSEIVSAFQNLSESQQEQVLNFIKFLSEGNG